MITSKLNYFPKAPLQMSPSCGFWVQRVNFGGTQHSICNSLLLGKPRLRQCDNTGDTWFNLERGEHSANIRVSSCWVYARFSTRGTLFSALKEVPPFGIPPALGQAWPFSSSSPAFLPLLYFAGILGAVPGGQFLTAQSILQSRLGH